MQVDRDVTSALDVFSKIVNLYLPDRTNIRLDYKYRNKPIFTNVDVYCFILFVKNSARVTSAKFAFKLYLPGGKSKTDYKW